MTQPSYVPIVEADQVRPAYRLRTPTGWKPERVADLRTPGQPRGKELGIPGPDQGYALLIADRVRDRLHLQRGEDVEDVIAGCVAVALKRSSLLGRAPVVHDILLACTVWGFLDEQPAAELVALRKDLFDEVALPSHHVERNRIADAVPESTLRMTPADVAAAHASDWRSLLDVET